MNPPALEIPPQESAAWRRIPHLLRMPFYCDNNTLSAWLPSLLTRIVLKLSPSTLCQQVVGILQDLFHQPEALLGDPVFVSESFPVSRQQKERGLL